MVDRPYPDHRLALTCNGEAKMMNWKKLSLGLVTATLLATPVMAQGVYQRSGVIVSDHPDSAYVKRGYGVRATPAPGYYHGNLFHPAPRVGAFATAPWDDGSRYSYGRYGSYGLVERQW
jgi:hypothetical protein